MSGRGVPLEIEVEARGGGPVCEICKCTEDEPCQPHGCAWDPLWRARGRYICTSPRCLNTARRKNPNRMARPRSRR